MVNWIISDFPLFRILIFIGIDVVVYLWLGTNSAWKFLVSVFTLLFSVSGMFIFIMVHYDLRMMVYDEKLERLVIPEFIKNRPFKETDLIQKDEKFASILRDVNMKFITEMKVNYAIRDIKQLISFHDRIIANFMKRYFAIYKDLSLEDIQGWDRMLLVAKNIQDEDLKDIYAELVSPEIIQKYSNIRPTTQENSLKNN